MLKKTLAALIIAGLAGSAGMELGVQQASATPAAGYIPMTTTSYSHVQLVRWTYVRGRHGARYRYRRAGYGHYYGGYWYARPWWTIAVGPVVVGPGVYRPIYGPRYRYRRAGYGFYHRGYYYRRRWW
jgi:hypothetical protein